MSTREQSLNENVSSSICAVVSSHPLALRSRQDVDQQPSEWPDQHRQSGHRATPRARAGTSRAPQQPNELAAHVSKTRRACGGDAKRAPRLLPLLLPLWRGLWLDRGAHMLQLWLGSQALYHRRGRQYESGRESRDKRREPSGRSREHAGRQGSISSSGTALPTSE